MAPSTINASARLERLRDGTAAEPRQPSSSHGHAGSLDNLADATSQLSSELPLAAHARRAEPSTSESLAGSRAHAGSRGARAPHGYLTCQLGGGLSNQENMIENCLMLASLSRRWLVMPHSILTARGPLKNGENGHFGELWSASHLGSYAHARWNVTVIGENSWHERSLKTTSAFAYLKGWLSEWVVNEVEDSPPPAGGGGGVSMSPPQLARSNRFARPPEAERWNLLSELMLHNFSRHETIEAVQPFCMLTCPASGSSTFCCLPNQPTMARADAFMRTLPSEYDCVHARVELDWFRVCCKNNRGPDEWTPLERSGLCLSTRQPPPRSGCFQNASVLASLLHSSLAPPLPPKRALFVASGASDAELAPLSTLFDLRRLPFRKHNSNSFASYTEALAQRHVCAGANRFIGVHGSTFSESIIALRAQVPRFCALDPGAALCERSAAIRTDDVQYYGGVFFVGNASGSSR